MHEQVEGSGIDHKATSGGEIEFERFTVAEGVFLGKCPVAVGEIAKCRRGNKADDLGTYWLIEKEVDVAGEGEIDHKVDRRIDRPDN